MAREMRRSTFGSFIADLQCFNEARAQWPGKSDGSSANDLESLASMRPEHNGRGNFGGSLYVHQYPSSMRPEHNGRGYFGFSGSLNNRRGASMRPEHNGPGNMYPILRSSRL